MESGRTEQDFDELEKLLGEIPNVTSGNPEESAPKSASLNGGLATAFKGNLPEKVHSNGNLNERNNVSTKTQDSPIRGIEVEDPNLPDDQSLTSAFADLNFNSGIVPNLNLSVRGTPMSAGYCQPHQPFENSPLAANGLQSFQFLSNVAVPSVDFPLMSDNRQYYADLQPLLPCLHSQQLNQPRISWRNIEEEQFYRHQQYLYLRNQRLESQHPIPSNGNLPSKITNRSVRQQPYFEVPMQSNQDPFWNSCPVTKGLNVSDKVVKQFPEKILTRSQGQDTLKTVLSNGHHLSSWNFFPDIADYKSSNLRPQAQKYNSVDEITGRVYLMAKDQHGCRLLQRKFSEGTQQDVEKIFLEVIDHIVELMTDPFGNYLVQKLLEVCNEEQRMQILRAATRKPGELVRISCDMHGTRAVQKVIETLKTSEQIFLVVYSLKPGIVTLIKNMNGNHVAQHCLQYLAPEYSGFLFDAAITNCVELATDRHGCCVLQKCLSHSEGEQRQYLISEITSNALILSQDPYGNYVVQFIFELQLPWAAADILEQLEGNFGDLAMQKYSSNVVEKCLKYSSEERRAHIIRELINNVHLDQVMQDPYGNYVIQAALHQSKGAPHAALVEAIRPHIPLLRTSPYGKKVLSSNCFKK